MKSHTIKPDQLFTCRRRIQVPFFQRTYVWTDDEWERFLNSMIEINNSNDKEYFMGCLIFKQQETSATESIGDVRLLIDGQQRLTTFLIFMRILYDTIYKSDAQERYKTDFFNAEEEPILRHNYNDIECFNAIANGQVDEDLRSKYRSPKTNKCINGLLDAFDYFRKDQRTKKFKDEGVIDVIKKKLYFIVLELKPDEDEQRAFDTINSIGVSLTAAELLKNELFSYDDKDLYEETWKKEFETGEKKEFWDEISGQGRNNIDLLMQSSLLIFSEAKLEYENIGKLFGNYKKHLNDKGIEKGNKKFIEKLHALAKCYRKNIDYRLLADKIDTDKPIQRLMPLIFGSRTATAIPYILFILDEVKDESEQDDIFSFLENYLARRIICGEKTKDYHKLFVQMIRDGVKSRGKLIEFFSKSDKNNAFPKNETLGERFMNREWDNRSMRDVKAILYLLDILLGRDEKSSTELKPYDDFSIEHIMPKGWREHWNGENVNEEIEEERDRLVITAGNLAIITPKLNNKISNSSWKEKKKKLKEYATGSKTFDRFLDKEQWDEKAIEERAQWLYKQSLDIWPDPGKTS